MVIGDFNAITRGEEKKGGDPPSRRSMDDFTAFIGRGALTDAGFTGNAYTWCNNRSGIAKIWMRLDRLLLNGPALASFPGLVVRHLPRICSDHCPLSVCCDRRRVSLSFFKLHHSWTMHDSFKRTIAEAWEGAAHASPLLNVARKLKRLRGVLRRWNWNEFGNLPRLIAADTAKLEAIERSMQEGSPSIPNDDWIDARRMLRLHEDMLYSMLEDKARLRWAESGDRSTALFHAAIKVRRSQNRMSLELEDGSFSEDRDVIGPRAAAFFEELFSAPSAVPDVGTFNHISPMVSAEDNVSLTAIPSGEEVLMAIRSMEARSSPGPDGFTGHFFLHCWDIVGEDVIRGVQSFFRGAQIPQAISAAALVLIPKIPGASHLNQLRPISLCNMLHKIISRVMADRLRGLLPRIISPEQAGFVQGRNIQDNIALAHDMVTHLHEKVRGGNVMMKIDMVKAFDRISWLFIIRLMRALGFSEVWCDLVFRNISNCWYNVRWEGKQYGWFKSHRGVRQGDPLSPAIFVLAMDFLSRSLNGLIRRGEIEPFSTKAGAIPISHLLFADDLLIFSNGSKRSIRKVLGCLNSFCTASGQEINSSKTHLFLSKHINYTRKLRLLDSTGFCEGSFPVQYLGAPLFQGRPRISFFQLLVDRLRSRISSWMKSFLSFAGRATLIKSVLSAMPVHSLAVLPAPKAVVRQLDSAMGHFLWNQGSASRRHWLKWSNVCAPESDGGLGFQSMEATLQGLHGRVAWKLMSSDSLWASFARSCFALNRPGSPLWNSLRPIVKSLSFHSNWVLGAGSTSLAKFCFGIGASSIPALRSVPIRDILLNPARKARFLALNPDLHCAEPDQESADPDRLHWNLSSDGTVSASSFLSAMKPSSKKKSLFKAIWRSWIPRKLSGFIWKILHHILPTDATIQQLGIPLASRCLCCSSPQIESSAHLLLDSDWAVSVWSLLNSAFSMPSFTTLTSLLRGWLVERDKSSFHGCLGAALAVCGLWEIWLARNRSRHGEASPLLPFARLRSWAFVIKPIIHHPIRPTSSASHPVLEALAIPTASPPMPLRQAWKPFSGGTTLSFAAIEGRGVLFVGAIFRNSHGGFISGLRAVWRTSFLSGLERLVDLWYPRPLAKIQTSHPAILMLSSGILHDQRGLRNHQRIASKLERTQVSLVSASGNQPALALAFGRGVPTGRLLQLEELPLSVRICLQSDNSPAPVSFLERVILVGFDPP